MERILLRLVTFLSIFALVFLAVCIPGVLASTFTFGQTEQSGITTNPLSTICGSQYTTTLPGQAESISAYLSFTPTKGYFGQKTEPTWGPFWNIGNAMAGQEFTSPPSTVVAQSITGSFIGDSQPHKVKAAIYDANGNFIVGSEEKSIAGTSPYLETFELTTPTLLSPSTNYIIVAWSDSAKNHCNLIYNGDSINGKQVPSVTYGDWPTPQNFVPAKTHSFFIWCNYQTTTNVQCAIYSADGTIQLGMTEQKTITSTTEGWVTFNLDTQPALDAGAQYVLAAWASDPNTQLYYTGTTAPELSDSPTYPNWPTSIHATGEHYNYNLYCTLSGLAVVPEPPFTLAFLAISAALAIFLIYHKNPTQKLMQKHS